MAERTGWCQCLLFCFGVQWSGVPYPDRGIIASGGEQVALWPEAYSGHLLVVGGEGEYVSPRNGVPYLDGIIRASRCDAVTSGAPAGVEDRSAMALERGHQFALPRIKDFHASVITAGDDLTVIRAECDTVDRAPVGAVDRQEL